MTISKHEEFYKLGYKKINEKYKVFSLKDLFDIWICRDFYNFDFVKNYRMRQLLKLDKMKHSNYTQFKSLALGLDEG